MQGVKTPTKPSQVTSNLCKYEGTRITAYMREAEQNTKPFEKQAARLTNSVIL